MCILHCPIENFSHGKFGVLGKISAHSLVVARLRVACMILDNCFVLLCAKLSPVVVPSTFFTNRHCHLVSLIVVIIIIITFVSCSSLRRHSRSSTDLHNCQFHFHHHQHLHHLLIYIMDSSRSPSSSSSPSSLRHNNANCLLGHGPLGLSLLI